MLIVFLSDIHVPYHDPKAIELACKIIEYVKPCEIIVGGDRVDFYQVSSFDRNPERVLELQKDLDKAEEIGRAINDAAGCDTEIVELMGNHEDRWGRYLSKHPEIAMLDVLSLPSLLKHKELGWDVSKQHDRHTMLGGRLIFKHGEFVRKWSGYSAKAEIENVKFQASVVSGHTHRMGSFYSTGPRHTVGAWEAGCLCSLEPEYKQGPDWQQGLIVVDLSDNPQVHHFQAMPIVFTGKGVKRARVFGTEFVVR